MNGVIVSIVAGIVVAVVGAFAAYYFGGWREKQKQEAEQSERRVEVLTEIRSQCSTILEDVRNWAAKAAALPNSKPPGKVESHTMDLDLQRWRNFYALCGKIYKQGHGISAKMSSLKTYFEKNEQQLPTSTRNAFETFEQDFYKRHGSLKDAFATSKHRDNSTDSDVRIGKVFAGDNWEANLDYALWAFDDIVHGATTGRWYRKFGLRKALQDIVNDLDDGAKEILPKVSEAAKYAQGWSAQPYVGAFDKEIAKYAKTEV